MNLGIKFLIGGISLATASCVGYFVYKKTTGSSVEKVQDVQPESVDEKAKQNTAESTQQRDS